MDPKLDNSIAKRADFDSKFAEKAYFFRTFGLSSFALTYKQIYQTAKESMASFPANFCVPSINESEIHDAINLLCLADAIFASAEKKLIRKLKDNIISIKDHYCQEETSEQKEVHMETFFTLQNIQFLDDNFEFNIGNDQIFIPTFKSVEKSVILTRNKLGSNDTRDYLFSCLDNLLIQHTVGSNLNNHSAMDIDISKGQKRPNEESETECNNNNSYQAQSCVNKDIQSSSTNTSSIGISSPVNWQLAINNPPIQPLMDPFQTNASLANQLNNNETTMLNPDATKTKKDISNLSLAQIATLPKILMCVNPHGIAQLSVKFEICNKKKLIKLINECIPYVPNLSPLVEITSMENIKSLLSDNSELHQLVIGHIYSDEKLQKRLLYEPPTQSQLKNLQGIDSSDDFTEHEVTQIIITNIPPELVGIEHKKHLTTEFFHIIKNLKPYVSIDPETFLLSIVNSTDNFVSITTDENSVPTAYACAFAINKIKTKYKHFQFMSTTKTKIVLGSKSREFKVTYGITLCNEDIDIYNMSPICVIRGADKLEAPFLGVQVEHEMRKFFDEKLDNVNVVTVPMYFRIGSGKDAIRHTLPCFLVVASLTPQDQLNECRRVLGLNDNINVIKIRERYLEMSIDFPNIIHSPFSNLVKQTQAVVQVHGLGNTTAANVLECIKHDIKINNIDYIAVIPVQLVGNITSTHSAYIFQKTKLNHSYNMTDFHHLSPENSTLIAESFVFGHFQLDVSPKASMFSKEANATREGYTTKIQPNSSSSSSSSSFSSHDGFTIIDGKKGKTKPKK